VHVRGFSKPVVLRRIDGTTAEIEAGPLRMKVGLDEITGVEGTTAASSARSTKGSVTVRVQASDEGTGGEINLIGCTVEEATERVDKFLDEAALANRSRVRIIHGHGTGALRKGLTQFLSKHPLVDSQSFEAEERGGKAVTIVELRA
jgi:DNA mismatch repair protein MutS2